VRLTDETIVDLIDYRTPYPVVKPGDLVWLRHTPDGVVADVDGRDFGTLPRELDDLDVQYHEARAVYYGARGLRIRPFHFDDCGCIRNLGGWHVVRCAEHPAGAAPVCDHGRTGYCGMCEFEAQRLGAQDRREIEKAQE
jgi:hypothetical protein